MPDDAAAVRARLAVLEIERHQQLTPQDKARIVREIRTLTERLAVLEPPCGCGQSMQKR
jgi:cation transport ATPase